MKDLNPWSGNKFVSMYNKSSFKFFTIAKQWKWDYFFEFESCLFYFSVSRDHGTCKGPETLACLKNKTQTYRVHKS